MSFNWPAVNSDIAEGISTIGMAASFSNYPDVVGDGVHDDTAGMQAAIDDNVGGMIIGTPGKTYVVTSPLYLPTRTKCYGQGATIMFPLVMPDLARGMFMVGLPGEPAGDELRATDIEITGWRFVSATGGKGQAGVAFRPGSERVTIRDCHFESTYETPSLTGIFLNKKRLRNVTIDHCTYYRIQRFVYVRGSEVQTGTDYLYNVLGTNNVQETIQSGGAAGGNPAAPGTTSFVVPDTAPEGEDISPRARMLPPYNWRWGVTINYAGDPAKQYRLYGAADGGTDMSFDGISTVTIAPHIGALPTDSNATTRFFVWNPAVDPANDLNGLSVTNNSGKYTTSSPIQLSCQVTAMRNNAVPKIDGLRNVIVDNNRLEFTYLPTGNITNVTVSDDEDARLTNYALYSEDFVALYPDPPPAGFVAGAAVWVRTGLSTPLPGYWGPRYDTSRPAATRLPENNGSGQHKAVQTITLPNTGNWTASQFVQAGTRSTARLTWETSTGIGAYVEADLIAGTITTTGVVGGGVLNFYGIIPYGDGWFRVYLDVPIGTTTGRFTLALTNGTGVITYTGSASNYLHAFGLQVEDQPPAGNAYWLRNSSPSNYKPTLEEKYTEIHTNVISINGTTNFEVTNNIISASAGQAIHVEDGSSNGTISHNTISDATYGINVTNSHNISITSNSITRFYKSAIMIAGQDPGKRKQTRSGWCEFTGSASGTTLTVTALNIGNLNPNAEGSYKTLTPDKAGGATINAFTRIVKQLTGTAGGVGTYQLSKTSTATSRTMSAAFGQQCSNIEVSGNVVDTAGFPSVQTGYWFGGAYDPLEITFDNAPVEGLGGGPIPTAQPVYYYGLPKHLFYDVVADGVMYQAVNNPTLLVGASVTLGSNIVTVNNSNFTQADVGKTFQMMNGGSPVSFAGASIKNPGTGYHAEDTIDVDGTIVKIWSITSIGTPVITSNGTGGPPDKEFIVKGLSPGRRARRDAARITVRTNALGEVSATSGPGGTSGIVRVDKSGIYIDPDFDGQDEGFDTSDYPDFTGLVMDMTMGVFQVRRNATCFYGRILETTPGSGVFTKLRVDEMIYGETITVGDKFTGVEVKEGTTITALGPTIPESPPGAGNSVPAGTGGLGTYTLSQSHPDMADNDWLFVVDNPYTTTTPTRDDFPTNIAPGTGPGGVGVGTDLRIWPRWRGVPLVGTITHVLSPTQIKLDTTAACNAEYVSYCYGTDNGPTIQAALDAGQEVMLPAGTICHSTQLTYKAKSRLIGKGSSLGFGASTTLAYVGPNLPRGKQLSGDADSAYAGGVSLDGAVIGNFHLAGNNLIGIGHYQRACNGCQMEPMNLRGHTYIGVQLTGGVKGANVANVNSTYIVRENMESTGYDTTGIYIGPGELTYKTGPDDTGVADTCRTFYPYWQVDVDGESFGRSIWYRVADSSSHGFVKARGASGVPAIEFGGHDKLTRFARSIHFSYMDSDGTRLRGGAYPSEVVVSFFNFLNGATAAEVEGVDEGDGSEDFDEEEDLSQVITEFGARYMATSNRGTLTAPGLQPYKFDSRQEPRKNLWRLMPITNSITNIPGAEITGNGSHQVLAFTDGDGVLRVLQPMDTVGTPTLKSTFTPTTGTNLIRSMIPSGNLLYLISSVTAGNTYLHVIDFSDPAAPVEISETLIGAGNAVGQSQLAGSYLYVGVNDATNSIRIIDISDPWTPVLVATTNTGNAGVGGLAVAGNVLFVGTRTNGSFRAYGLGGLPSAPQLLNNISIPSVELISQIVVRGKYAYVTENSVPATDLSLHIIDISNPSALTVVGSYDASLGQPGDYSCRGLAISGSYAFTVVTKSAVVVEPTSPATYHLHVVNIANPALPTIALDANDEPVTLVIQKPPQTNGNPLVLNGNYIYLPVTGGGNDVYRINVENPLAPFLSDSMGLGATNDGMAVVISGNIMFAATDTAANNLMMYQILGYEQEAAVFGSLHTDRARLDHLDVDRDARINGGLSIGNNGLSSKGTIAGTATQTRVYTVATLPTGRMGMRAMVSDALTPAFLATVAGGGAVRTPVFWDDAGSAWKVG